MDSKNTSSTAADNDDLSSLLARLEIEPCYYDLLSQLCGGKSSYVGDIAVEDIQGQKDSEGNSIPPAVARGLIRKIKAGEASHDATSTTTTAKRQTIPSTVKSSGGVCTLSLQRGDGDYSSLLRCNVKGQIVGDNSGESRHKVLVAILDNSGSMGRQWPLVVQAIGRVFTDELLADRTISLNAVVYNTDAREVNIPETSDKLQNYLKHSCYPRGITNFQSAFQNAEKIISREVNKFQARGIKPSNVDITVLLFTDGEDTSAPPLGYKTKASTQKARMAGDLFRSFLARLDCSSYVSVAAFGEHHNPEQCQYLSDRYYYINRQEVLSEWLAGGLSDMLESAGFVAPKMVLPQGLIMAEPLPNRIGLDLDGCIEQEIWLRDESRLGLSATDEVKITMENASSCVAIEGSVMLSSAAVICSESLQGRTFLIEWAEMQLRQIALELRGKHPSPIELALLREKLMGVKESVKPILKVASNAKSQIQGRSLLLARLDDLENRRNRLSYTLGHFEVEKGGDTRSIGAVGIDAVLRDASQKVPLSNTAKEWLRVVDAASALSPMKKELSPYGKRSTFDPISGCDAKTVASFGDVMFYRLDGKSFPTLVDCGNKPIAYEVFALLSENGKKPIMTDNGKSFTRVGIPMYVSAEHFHRVQLFLPTVSKQLSDDGVYNRSSNVRMFLKLLGRSLASHLKKKDEDSSSSTSDRDNLSLTQKARSVHAILDSEIKSNCKSSLDEWLQLAENFIDDAKSRNNCDNLYEVATAGLLAVNHWPSHRIVQLGDTIVEESLRRILVFGLQNKSESERLKLAWSLLSGGHPVNDQWLDCSLESPSIAASLKERFDILAASDDLKHLEEEFPGELSPRDAAQLATILTSNDVVNDSIRISECFALRSFFSQWTSFAEKEASDNGGMWNLIDMIMVEGTDITQQEEILGKLDAMFEPSVGPQSLRDILVRPTESLSQFAAHCLEDLPSYQKFQQSKEKNQPALPPRLELAAVIDSIVKERENCARKYAIKDADYPSCHPMSATEWAKNWGAEAYPVDKILYTKVRSWIHRNNFDKPLTVKEALTDKAYRKHGGQFAFPSQLDTFIPGLHRRTRDLHKIWKRIGKETRGPLARKNAVEEMLLRLRWDDRDRHARVKLSKIVGIIWDGLENVPAGLPVSSALWLHDDSSYDDEIEYDSPSSEECAKGMEGKEISILKTNSDEETKGDNKVDDWSVITGG